jgi:hypothetical protein
MMRATFIAGAAISFSPRRRATARRFVCISNRSLILSGKVANRLEATIRPFQPFQLPGIRQPRRIRPPSSLEAEAQAGAAQVEIGDEDSSRAQ